MREIILIDRETLILGSERENTSISIESDDRLSSLIEREILRLVRERGRER